MTVPIRRILAFAAAVSFVIAPQSGRGAQKRRVPQPVIFTAPAGRSPVEGTSSTDPFARVLPSGRIVRPTGTSVAVGTNALGFALSPDGRYAIVSNGDERDGNAGFSLTVVDTATMTVVSRYANSKQTYYAGVVALADPANPNTTLVLASGGPTSAVYAFDLNAAGTLVPDAHPAIAIPGRAFPGTLVLSGDATRAYVVDALGNDVAQIDVAKRALAGPPVDVGFFPFGAAVTPQGLLVANEGLAARGVAAAPALAPPFANVAPDLTRASSLSLLPLATDGSLGSGSGTTSIPLDRAPDGVHAIGGAHPAAIVALKKRPFAFVAMSNVDRIATIALAPPPIDGAFPPPRAAGGTELRLYDRGPYGTQPTALALSSDEKRLYVALSGIDAIAVLDSTDPTHLHRVGLIPTGWYPDAVQLSSDERYLYVANAKGDATSSTLERIDLRSVDLRRSTPSALAAIRKIEQPKVPNQIVPQRFLSRGSTVIKHVVLILEEGKTYDAMLGDLTDAAGAPYGPGDPRFVSFGAAVTPNLHALARTYGLAGNLYADGIASAAGHQVAAGGIASAFTEKTMLVNGAGPFASHNEDPEDYPRAGYIWNSLADYGKSYRDYGDLLRVSGYDQGAAADPKTDDPQFVSRDETAAPTHGLGGLYALDVPALAALSGHVDLDYPGWDPRIRDARRALEFVRDFDPLVKADTVPAFTEIYLPADGGGVGADVPPLAEEVADGDRALGTIVDYLTHTPQWDRTAIVIMPADAGTERDHVSGRRSYAIVVSPYARRHYVGMRHLSTASVLKTEEEVLGLPALSLGDELTSDMSDFFTPIADRTPYIRTVVPAQAGRIGARARDVVR